MIIKVDGNKDYPQISLWEEGLERVVNSIIDSKIIIDERISDSRKIEERRRELKREIDVRKSSYFLVKDENAAILVRIGIIDLERKIKEYESKYVFLQTYFDNGELSTIDIVNMPFAFHKDIYEKFLGINNQFDSDKPVLPKEISRQYISNEAFLRYLIAGGFMKLDSDGLKIDGGSGAYSNKIFHYNVNDITSYLIHKSKLFRVKDMESVERGKKYIDDVLDLMSKYKGEEFYSKLIDFYVINAKKMDAEIDTLRLAPLLNMKVIDKALREGRDFYEVSVEETPRFEKEVLMKSLAYDLKKKD